MAKRKGATEVPIYQIKVTLKDSKPPIWRRLLVRGDITLADLHDVIQAAFGWLDYHLHQFIIGETYYGVPNPDFFDYPEMHDERKLRLQQITDREGYKFDYEYDFGDSWIHEIRVEKILPPQPGQNYPLCTAGRRACPPEDVGGIWGYYYFLEALEDPNHEDHEMYLDWTGGGFDPNEFDLDGTNAALRELRRA
jgi:hypothetical protein